MDDIVTVIVPVYNVKEYLSECIASIIHQTYKNLEIIIVDDGSTDGSSEICDKFQRKDRRITVIHKENGGLSSARNCGLEVAKGRYISFIDSDDFILPDMIETLLNSIKKNDADVACCDFFSDRNSCMEYEGEYVFDRETAISRLFDAKGFCCYAWNKLYRKFLFDNIQYPVGELFEDIKTTYAIFKKSTRISYVRKREYFYRLREESITHREFNEKDRDLLLAINFVMRDSQWMNSVSRNRLLSGYVCYYLSFLKKAAVANANINEEFEEFRKFAKQHKTMIITSRYILIRFKVEIGFILCSFGGFKKMIQWKNMRTVGK